MDALAYDGAWRAYTKAEKLQGDDRRRAQELLEFLPDDMQAAIEDDRRNLTRFGGKR